MEETGVTASVTGINLTETRGKILWRHLHPQIAGISHTGKKSQFSQLRCCNPDTVDAIKYDIGVKYIYKKSNALIWIYTIDFTHIYFQKHIFVFLTFLNVSFIYFSSLTQFVRGPASLWVFQMESLTTPSLSLSPGSRLSADEMKLLAKLEEQNRSFFKPTPLFPRSNNLN